VREALAAAAHILNDGSYIHTSPQFLNRPLTPNALPDVDLAEAELAKGTSPFHKVRALSYLGLSVHG
jgi:hypothetical protein